MPSNVAVLKAQVNRMFADGTGSTIAPCSGDRGMTEIDWIIASQLSIWDIPVSLEQFVLAQRTQSTAWGNWCRFVNL